MGIMKSGTFHPEKTKKVGIICLTLIVKAHFVSLYGYTRHNQTIEHGYSIKNDINNNNKTSKTKNHYEED